MAAFTIDSNGMVRERQQTPAERRATLLHIAMVEDREADVRQHQPEFAAWLRACAAKCRQEADAIDLSPDQPDLFAAAHEVAR